MENRIRKYFEADDAIPFPAEHEDIRLAVQDSVSFLGTPGTLEVRAYHFNPSNDMIPEHYLYHFFPSDGDHRILCDITSVTDSLLETECFEDLERIQVHGPGDGFPAFIEIQGMDGDLAFEIHIYTAPLPVG
ncbi:MAG: hypothetical protein JWN86_2267 [Planctomycetota bacterium]|nr:hypothetical protein [Planctomycetota bacterium]